MHGDGELDLVLRELRMRARSSDPAARLLGYHDIARWSPSTIEQLLRDGAIHTTTPDSFAECRECDEWHWEPVHWLGPKCFIACARAGLVPIVPVSLSRWQVKRVEGADLEGHGGAAAQGPIARGVPVNVFKPNGEYWELRYQGGLPFPLRATKGLRDIWELIRRSGDEISAKELVQITTVVTSVGAISFDHLGVDNGAGLPLADEQTVAAVKQRLQDLEEEQATSRGRGDIDAAVDLGEEQAKLSHYLSSVTGKRGKLRMNAGSKDRARTAVKNRIDSAIARIEKKCPEMALHFNQSIETGLMVVYRPAIPMSWQLS